MATSIVRNKLTAVLIGAAGMGISELYFRTANFLSNACNLGLGFSAIRKLSENFEDTSDVNRAHYVKLIRSWVMLTAALAFLLTLAFAPLLSHLAGASGQRVAGFMALAPMVALMILQGGELAVLKGLRRLRELAKSAVQATIITLFSTIGIYLWLGTAGILPVLIVAALVNLLTTLHYSTRYVPYRLSFGNWRFFKQGIPLVRLGMAYVVAGIASTGAELLVRYYFASIASEVEVGLYAAGLTLTVSYARMVFIAMDSDFFPQLSAVVENHISKNQLISRQTDVLILLITPFLLLFSLLLPVIVPLIYTGEFIVVVPMVNAALLYMFFKAAYLPTAYLPLAAGHPVTYMTMEIIYDAEMVVCVVAGYHLGGLTGAGIGLSVANLLDLLAIIAVYIPRYKLKLERNVVLRSLVQFLLLTLGLALSFTKLSLPVYGLRVGCLVLSAGITFYFLWHKSGFRLH